MIPEFVLKSLWPALRMAAVVALVGLAGTLTLPNLIGLMKPEYGDFGIDAGIDNVVFHTSGDAQRAGVVPGDYVDYARMPLRDRYLTGVRTPRAGTRVTYEVVHNGVEREVPLIATRSAGGYTAFALSELVLKKAAWLMFALLAAGLVLVRPLPVTWTVFFYSIGATYSGPFYWSFLAAPLYAAIYTFNDILWSLGMATLLVLAVCIGNDSASNMRRSQRLGFFAFCMLVAANVYTDLRSIVWGLPPGQIVDVVSLMLCAAVCAAAAVSIRKALGSRKLPLAAVAGGLMIGAIGVSGNYIIDLDPGFWMTPNWLFQMSTVIAVLASLMAAYLIVRHRLVDLRDVLARSIIYGSLSLGMITLLVLANMLWGSWFAATAYAIPIEILGAVGIGLWLSGLVDVVTAHALVEVEAPAAAAHGDRASERDIFYRALARAERTRSRGLAALVRAEATFAAWFAGDEAEFRANSAALSSLISAGSLPGLGRFSRCALGVREIAPPDANDAPEWISRSHLVAAGSIDDVIEARDHAAMAVVAADNSDAILLQVASRIALAEFDPDQRTILRKLAFEISSAAGFSRLAEAVRVVDCDGDDLGVLTHFISKLRAPKSATPVLDVRFATATVLARGRPIQLRDREMELLLLIARERQPTSIDAIADAMWPDLDGDAARLAFRVCLHRLRRALGDASAVRRIGESLQLCDGAVVDLRQFVDLRDAAAAKVATSTHDFDGLRRAYESLREGRRRRIRMSAWFESAERGLISLEHDMATILSASDHVRSDYPDAQSAPTVARRSELNQ